MSIHNRVHEVYRSQLERDLLDRKVYSVSGALDVLFDEDGDYRIYHDADPYSKNNTINSRLHLLWLTPCWIVCAPFLWLFTGEIGISQHSKLGKWIAKKTGI